MKVAAYVRVSTDRQAEQGVSIEDQVRQAEKWAKAQGHVLVKVFHEPGQSAYKETERPVFREMLDAATSLDHPFDAIVVHSQSRFSRDNVQRAVSKRKLQKADVELVRNYVAAAQSYKTTT